jgi:acetyltransferase-like isoleucine patch superfamily enzyme
MMKRLQGLVANRILALNTCFGHALGHDFNVAWVLRLLRFSVGSGTVVHAYSLHPNSVIGDNARVGRGVLIGERVTIGAGSEIHPGAALGPDVSIGSRCLVGEGARLQRISVGDGTQIDLQVLCTGYGHGRITIGRECYIAPWLILDWSDNIDVGDYAHIGATLWTHSSVRQALHGDPLRDKTRRPTSPVVIGSRVYVGWQSTVYPGVTIGSETVILPSSAVPKDVPSGVLAGGVPAKVLRPIKADDLSELG